MYTLSIHIGRFNNSSPKIMFPYMASTGRGYAMNIGHVGSIAATIGGGFFAGIIVGYALKKVAKLVAVMVGLFFAGLTYLQYQQIIDINWNKLQQASQNTVTTLANATTQIPGHEGILGITSFGIPLTGSMSMGFAIGFLKG